MATTPPHYIGQRLSYDGGALCTVRYVGEVAGTTGAWLGVEWDDPARGRHAGEHGGVRYFSCLSKSPSAASFLRPTRPTDPPRGFLSALRGKYDEGGSGGGDTKSTAATAPSSTIQFSGKVVEEVGFDKIRQRLARLQDLRIAVLDGFRVAIGCDNQDQAAAVSETCPGVTELDLSRNLLEEFAAVVEVCRGLPNLKTLRLSGNRFRDLRLSRGDDDPLARVGVEESGFRGVADLTIGEMLLSWEDMCAMARSFPSLAHLGAGTNQLSRLPVGTGLGSLAGTLTTLNLEYNDFAALSDLACLAGLAALRSLILKGNDISMVEYGDGDSGRPKFSPSLRNLDLSYNRIDTWAFVDELPAVFPGLTGLRLSHNPIYDSPDDDRKGGSGSNSKPATGSDEAFMITVGRIAGLATLNFGPVSPSDRINAEMFYLSRIGRQLASTAESAEAGILAGHPRFGELCRLHGAPDVIRREETNPEFLEARLVTVTFTRAAPATAGSDESRREAIIPKSYDIYGVRGIAGRLFGLPPLRVRLVWETGEWDPVGGLYDDDQEGDDSGSEEEEDDGQDRAQARDGDAASAAPAASAASTAPAAPAAIRGRWVKREVELREGPRQLGFCVDGPEARIRVEMLG